MTPGFRRALYARDGGQVACALLTISHVTEGTFRISTDTTQRLTDDPVTYGTISRGQAYQFCPCDVLLPLSERGSEPVARLAIANVSRDLVPLVRSVEAGITCKIEIVDPAEPDIVQRDVGTMRVTAASYSATEIVITMRHDLRINEQFPKGKFTPGGFPGIFT